MRITRVAPNHSDNHFTVEVDDPALWQSAMVAKERLRLNGHITEVLPVGAGFGFFVQLPASTSVISLRFVMIDVCEVVANQVDRAIREHMMAKSRVGLDFGSGKSPNDVYREVILAAIAKAYE